MDSSEEERMLLGDDDSCEAVFTPTHTMKRTPPPENTTSDRKLVPKSGTQPSERKLVSKSGTQPEVNLEKKECCRNTQIEKGNSAEIKISSDNGKNCSLGTDKITISYPRYTRAERKAYRRLNREKGQHSGDLKIGAACSNKPSNTGVGPSGKGDLCKGTYSKRNRSPGGTPEEHKKVEKIPKTQGSELSYAKVAAACDYRVAVVPRGAQMELTQEQAKLLTEKIIEAVTEHIDSAESDQDSTPLKFPSCGLVRGIFVVNCLDKPTYDWLETAIKNLSCPWEDAQLEIVDFDKLPKPVRVSVNIKGKSDVATETVFTRLRRQNPGLVTAKWRTYSRNEAEWGLHLVLGIDQDSMDFLKKTNHKLFYLVGVVSFLTAEAESELKMKKAAAGATTGIKSDCSNQNAAGKSSLPSEETIASKDIYLKPSLLQDIKGSPLDVDAISPATSLHPEVISGDLAQGSANKEGPVQFGYSSEKGDGQHSGSPPKQAVTGSVSTRFQ